MAHLRTGSEGGQSGHLPPPPGVDSEAGQVRPESNFRGLSDVQKWQKGDWMKKGALALMFRAVALLFSFLTFMLVVTISGFTYSSDLCYLLSIGLIVMVYTAVFVGIKGHELRTGDVVSPQSVAVWMEFFGDQILALLLLSASSSAATALRLMQLAIGVYSGHQILDQSTGAVVMAFLGFFSLQSAALISGYHLSVHLFTS